MQKISVETMFDCTRTGFRTYQKTDSENPEYSFKRNQQRNWETLLQCIGLRCQPLNISGPYIFSAEDGTLTWNFSFDIDRQDIFLHNNDPLGHLKNDCHGVPMIVGLTENNSDLFFTPYIVSQGNQPNTVFFIDSDK